MYMNPGGIDPIDLYNFGGEGWLSPLAFDVEWTSLSDGVVLNDNPAAWVNADGSIGAWTNPCTTRTIPIAEDSGGVLALLTMNPSRTMLTIQNNSLIVTAGDEAPTFYVSFGQLAQMGQGLGLPPGVGLVYDTERGCPRDSVYLTIGPSVNTHGTVIVQGAIVEGAYAPVNQAV